MSASPVIALRKAVHDALAADAQLVSLLGGPRVFDTARRGAQPPYVTSGDARTRDWSTQTDKGAEHVLALDVWSQQPGAQEALTIAARMEVVLDGAPLTLSGHRLVDLRFQQIETRRENQGRFMRASLRFRAVTETL